MAAPTTVSPCPLPALPLLNKDTGLDDVERAEDALPPGGRINRSTRLGEPNPVPAAVPAACFKDGGTGRGGDFDRTAPAPLEGIKPPMLRSEPDCACACLAE